MKDIDSRSAAAPSSAAPEEAGQEAKGGKAALRSGTVLSRGLHVETLEPRLLMSADLIPVAGSIDVPGETDYYTFDLATECMILFDALTPDARFAWAL